MNYIKKQLIFLFMVVFMTGSVLSMPCHWHILNLDAPYDFDDLIDNEQKKQSEIERIREAYQLRLNLVKNASHKILEDIDQESKSQKKSLSSPHRSLQLSSSAPSMSSFDLGMLPRKNRSHENNGVIHLRGEDLRENLCKRIVAAAQFILKCLDVDEAMIKETIKLTNDDQNNTNSYNNDQC